MSLFEQPLIILFAGVLVERCLARVCRNQSPRFLGWVAVGHCDNGWIVVGRRFVVTETELVKATLHTMSRDLESNNVGAVTRHIASSSTDLKSEAESRLRMVKVDEAKIKRNLKVTVNDRIARPTAKATFNAVLKLQTKSGQFAERPIPRFFELDLRKEGATWKVESYQMHDPLEGLKQN